MAAGPYGKKDVESGIVSVSTCRDFIGCRKARRLGSRNCKSRSAALPQSIFVL
jgi:hypothetical protein